MTTKKNVCSNLIRGSRWNGKKWSVKWYHSDTKQYYYLPPTTKEKAIAFKAFIVKNWDSKRQINGVYVNVERWI